jgi:hypothetical protein
MQGVSQPPRVLFRGPICPEASDLHRGHMEANEPPVRHIYAYRVAGKHSSAASESEREKHAHGDEKEAAASRAWKWEHDLAPSGGGCEMIVPPPPWQAITNVPEGYARQKRAQGGRTVEGSL